MIMGSVVITLAVTTHPGASPHRSRTGRRATSSPRGPVERVAVAQVDQRALRSVHAAWKLEERGDGLSAGRVSGSAMCQKICQLLAPSMRRLEDVLGKAEEELPQQEDVERAAEEVARPQGG